MKNTPEKIFDWLNKLKIKAIWKLPPIDAAPQKLEFVRVTIK